MTEDFFKRMAMPTRLSDVELGESDIDVLIAKLEAHGMVALGEKQQVTPEVSRQILTAAL